jgi:hypothetical protein
MAASGSLPYEYTPRFSMRRLFSLSPSRRLPHAAAANGKLAARQGRSPRPGCAVLHQALGALAQAGSSTLDAKANGRRQ